MFTQSQWSFFLPISVWKILPISVWKIGQQSIGVGVVVVLVVKTLDRENSFSLLMGKNVFALFLMKSSLIE